MRAETARVLAEMTGDSDVPDLYIDVAAALDGTLTGPEPTIGRRHDGAALFYPAAVNVIYGAPESGKTWVCLGAGAEVLADGGRVGLIDVDHNGAVAILHRLMELGVRLEVLKDWTRFRLAVPEDYDEVLAVVADLAAWRADLALADSIGELTGMSGGSSNDAEDYARMHRAVFTPMAAAGVAVVATDHESKGSASRDYGSAGTIAKKRAVDGAMIRVTPLVAFTPGRGGKAGLTVTKDRHGRVREISRPSGRGEPYAATFELSQTDAGLVATLWAPTIADAPTRESDDVSLLRQLDPPAKSMRDVKTRMSWGQARATAAYNAYLLNPGGDE